MITQNEPLASLWAEDFEVEVLGPCRLPSPIARNLGDRGLMSVDAVGQVLVDDSLLHLKTTATATTDAGAEPALRGQLAFDLAGPRDRVYFDPAAVRAGIVTCGGLCPGLNNVVRGIVLELMQGYGVRQVLGYRFGYEGLISRLGHRPLPMTPESVAHIHHEGGTVLGSSRGEQDPTEVDVVLVPEVAAGFGDNDPLFQHLDAVLDAKGHAVVVVAEGAAQDLLPDEGGARQDRSGNIKLKDVGPFVRDRIGARYAGRGREVTVKYIDPSYQIRGVAACPSDSIYCWNMARHAVHAAMAGSTAMLIGRWHGRFVHVPMALATRNRRQVDPEGDLWMSVIEATGQPRLLV